MHTHQYIGTCQSLCTYGDMQPAHHLSWLFLTLDHVYPCVTIEWGATWASPFSGVHHLSKPRYMGRTMSISKMCFTRPQSKICTTCLSVIFFFRTPVYYGADLTQRCTHTDTYALASHYAHIVTCSQPTISLRFLTLYHVQPMCLH